MSAISNYSNKFSNKIGVLQSELTDSVEVDYIVGDRVYIASNHEKTGIVTYNGSTKFSDGIWIGVALDQPLGKHNGIVQGVTYFQCDDKHGIFVRKSNLRHANQKQTSIDFKLNQQPELENQLNNSNLIKPLDDDAFVIPNSIYVKSHLTLGERVCVIGKSSNSTSKIGTLRFIGHANFSEGIWAGIELDNPVGKNDGSVDGIRYFSCKPQYGLFALENKVQKYGTSRNIKTSNRMDSQSKFGSNESLSSVASNFSSASRTRVRLGMGVINSNGRSKGDKLHDNTGNKMKNVNSMSVVKEGKEITQGSTAFQQVLKEKEQHVEQLIREREIESIDLAIATSKIEELENQISRQINNFNEQSIMSERRLLDLQENNSFLIQEKEKLLEKLEEEKKKTEDLLFLIEEKNIDESDLENKTEESEHHIFELNEKLAHERDLREALEKKFKEISENNLMHSNTDNSLSSTEINKLKLQVENLQKELKEKRDSKISSMLKIIEEKDAVINDVQDRYETIKSKLEQSLTQLTSSNNEIMEFKSVLNENLTSIRNLSNAKKQLELDKLQLTNIVNDQNEKFKKFSSHENQTIMENNQKNIDQSKINQKDVEEKLNNNLETQMLNTEINKIKKIVEADKEIISNMELVIKANDKKLSEKESEIMDLNRKIIQIESDYTNQIKMKQNTINEKDDLCLEMSANLIQLEKLRQQISNMHMEKNNTSDQLSKAKQIEMNLNQEINELKDRIEFLEKENQALNDQLNAYESKHTDNSNFKTEMLNKISELETVIQNLNISLKSEKDANLEYITKNATLHSDLEQMRQKHDDSNNLNFEISNLQSIIANLEIEKKDLVIEYESKNNELMIVRERLLSISQEFENLQESHKNLNTKFDREKRITSDKIRKLEKQLDEPDKKSQFSHSDSLNEKRKMDSKDQVGLLKAAKDNAEEQISFLNLVIVEREKKFKLLETENENLKSKLKDFENGNTTLTVKQKTITPRLYCDVCEMFDFHDTDQCPVSANSTQSSPIVKIRQMNNAPRLYCDICEVFDLHNTSDCQDEQTF